MKFFFHALFFSQSIPYGQHAMCNVAKHPAVRTKNRFKNILPCECAYRVQWVCSVSFLADDHTRVKLNPNKGGMIGSDYINASYVKVSVRYLATVLQECRIFQYRVLYCISSQGYQPNEMFIASHGIGYIIIFVNSLTSEFSSGPTSFTIEDFWRMVHEQNVCCIVMLTHLMENAKVIRNSL